MQIVEALFDGEVFLPDAPLNLQEGARVRITVELIEKPQINESPSFLKTAQSLQLEGPSNWCEQIN